MTEHELTDVDMRNVNVVCGSYLGYVKTKKVNHLNNRKLYEIIIAAYVHGYGAAINDARENPEALNENQDKQD